MGWRGGRGARDPRLEEKESRLLKLELERSVMEEAEEFAAASSAVGDRRLSSAQRRHM